MNKTKYKRYLSILAIIGLTTLLVLAQTNAALAVTAPPLGAAQSFAVLGYSTVTNTGSSVITGDLGLYPNTSVTGFPPGIVVTGTIHVADAAAYNARNAAITAYNFCASQSYTPTHDLTGQNLGGLTLEPGVYHFDTSAQLTGILTLDAQNDPDSVFIFQIGSTLTTAPNSSVVEINAPTGFCNKFWQVGSSATIDTGTRFRGNILAQVTITILTGATVFGRALALTGAVTMDTNSVTNPICATTPLHTPSLSQWGLILLAGLLVLVGFFTLRKPGLLRQS